MKPIMLMLTTSLLIAASGTFAHSQGDQCSGQYAGCMDRCSSRPQSLQGSCSQTCENNTNTCYEGLYGRSQAGSTDASPAAAPEQSAAPQSDDARDAHGEARPRSKR